MAEVDRPAAQPRLPESAMPWAKEVNRAIDQLSRQSGQTASQVDRAYSAATGAASAATGAVAKADQVEAAVTTAPAAPGSVTVASAAYWDKRGLPKARATVTWDQVTTFYDGLPLGGTSPVSLYQVWAFPNDSAKAQLLGTYSPAGMPDTVTPDPGTITPPPPISLVIEDLAPATQYEFSVRARTVTGVWSDYSPVVVHTTAQMTEVPNAPTAPIADGTLGVVVLTWDGNLVVAGTPAPAPNTLSYVYAVFSNTQAGVYAPAGSSITRSEIIAVPGLEVGQTYWFKLGAVNNAGVSGPLSAAVSATVQGVDLGDLNQSVQDAIDEALAVGQSAQATADGKNTIYTSATQPSAGVEIARNAVPNPSFEVNIAGWEANTFGIQPPVRDTTRARRGGASARIPTVGAADAQAVGYSQPGERFPVTPGETIRLTVSIYATKGGINTGLFLAAFNGAGSLVSTPGGYQTHDLNKWVDLTQDILIPAGTAEVGVLILANGTAGSDVWFDCVSLGSPGYFDGNTADADGKTYAWTGAANASTSIQMLGGPIAGDLWWQLGTGPDAGSIINVNMYNGTDWVPYLLVADEILVPGSVGNVTIRDGAISAPKILAEEAFFDKIFTSEFMAYRIKVDQVVPNFGDTLNLGGNAVVITLNGRADEADVQITQTQQDVDSVQADADAAALAAADASDAVDALASGRVLVAENALDVLSGRIDGYDNSFLFLPDGLHIRESTSAIAEMVLTSAGARLVADGVIVSEWNQGQMIVDQIIANGGKIGNHILDASVAGHTTYRSIS